MIMKTAIGCILFLCSLTQVKAQQEQVLRQSDSLQVINAYLAKLYSGPEDFYYDTSGISYRNAAALLVQSGNKEMAINGSITLGLLDLYAGREDASIKNFKAALALDSSCYLCYHKLHWLYWYGKNNYGEANRYLKLSTGKFEALVLQDSGNVETWSKLFNLYKLKEGTVPVKMQQRMRYIAEKLVALTPGNAYYWWERSFQYKNNPPEEERALLKANDLEPGEAIYWNALAYFYFSRKEESKMRKVLEDARSYEEPNLLYWYQQKAYYLYHCGKKEEARNVFKEAKSKGFDIAYK